MLRSSGSWTRALFSPALCQPRRCQKCQEAAADLRGQDPKFGDAPDLIESLGFEDGNAGRFVRSEVVSVLEGQQSERLGGSLPGGPIIASERVAEARHGGGGGSPTGGSRGGADEGDERGLGLERGAAEELVEAREERAEVGGEVVGGLGGLDGRRGGQRGGELRALVLLVEQRVGERRQRGRRRRRGARSGARRVDERGAHGGVRVPDAAQRGGQEPRDERRHGATRVLARHERQQAQRVPAQRRPVGGPRVGDGRHEDGQLVGVELPRDRVQLGSGHRLRVTVRET